MLGVHRRLGWRVSLGSNSTHSNMNQLTVSHTWCNNHMLIITDHNVLNQATRTSPAPETLCGYLIILRHFNLCYLIIFKYVKISVGALALIPWMPYALTLPTSCMSCSCRSCDRVWCRSASCSGVSPSLSGMFRLQLSRTNSWMDKTIRIKHLLNIRWTFRSWEQVFLTKAWRLRGPIGDYAAKMRLWSFTHFDDKTNRLPGTWLMS